MNSVRKFSAISSPAKRRQEQIKTINSDTSSHPTFKEIYKPNRAHGRAGAIRQVFFLAYCGRHAPSGRRLSCDESYKKTIYLAHFSNYLVYNLCQLFAATKNRARKINDFPGPVLFQAVQVYCLLAYMRFSISCQAASLPRPVSEEKTINGSPLSMSSVSRTTFLCLSHLPFGILSAFVAMMMQGMP